MRIPTGLIIIAAAAAAATSAMAQPKVPDSQFLQASRCAGLASASNLGGGDAAAIDGWLKANSDGRSTFVTDRAAQVRTTAKMQANKAKGLEKDHLASELGGACASYKG